MTQGIKRALWTTVSLTVLMLGISSAITAAEVLSKQIPRAVKLDPVTMQESIPRHLSGRVCGAR